MLLCPPVRRKHSITEFPGRRMLYLCVMKKHDSKEKKKKKKRKNSPCSTFTVSYHVKCEEEEEDESEMQTGREESRGE